MNNNCWENWKILDAKGGDQKLRINTELNDEMFRDLLIGENAKATTFVLPEEKSAVRINKELSLETVWSKKSEYKAIKENNTREFEKKRIERNGYVVKD